MQAAWSAIADAGPDDAALPIREPDLSAERHQVENMPPKAQTPGDSPGVFSSSELSADDPTDLAPPSSEFKAELFASLIFAGRSAAAG